MTPAEFKDTKDQLDRLADSLLRTKGSDYTGGSTDRLANFKQVAALSSGTVTPEQVWSVYTLKHVLAVVRWASSGKVESEPLIQRFADLRNFCYLGYALSVEKQNKTEAVLVEKAKGSHPLQAGKSIDEALGELSDAKESESLPSAYIPYNPMRQSHRT